MTATEERRTFCKQWIESVYEVPIGNYRVRYSVNSYALKHLVEECFGSYIGEIDLKSAMEELGFEPVSSKTVGGSLKYRVTSRTL